MDDTSTPEAPVEDTGGSQPLPDTTDSASADNGQTPDASGSSSDDNSSDDNQPDDLSTWASSQGIDIDNPTPEAARKLAQRVRDTQAKMHEATQTQSQLRETVGGMVNDSYQESDDRIAMIEQRLQAEALDRRVTEYYIQNQDARNYDKQMAELVQKKPWLANDLDDLYKLAKEKAEGSTLSAASETARREERELLAQKQATATANQSAREVSTGSNKLTREAIAAMSVEEYRKRLPEINEAISSGTLT